MQSFWYLQTDLASIHSMTSKQAILIALKEDVADALLPLFIAKSYPVEVEVMLC